MRNHYVIGSCVLMGLVLASGGFSRASGEDLPGCAALPSAAQLRAMLAHAPDVGGEAGGLFHGRLMWGAVVNRQGDVCAYATSTSDVSQVWPGSQAIAKAKAYTANAFSLDGLALSTARLYTFVQPGHSLFGLNQSQPFNPAALGDHAGKVETPGGIITFGGGVPLYNSHGRIVGGLGVSGDTACTDHEIAKRVRALAGMNQPATAGVDDITYSGSDGATVVSHPYCINTWRNGVHVGEESAATGY